MPTMYEVRRYQDAEERRTGKRPTEEEARLAVKMAKTVEDWANPLPTPVWLQVRRKRR